MSPNPFPTPNRAAMARPVQRDTARPLMNWLHSLLGRDETPEERARQRPPHWSAWLKPIADAAPCGEDLSHDDEFLALKEEVTRLSAWTRRWR